MKSSLTSTNYVFLIVQQGLGGVPGIDGLPGDKGDKVRHTVYLFIFQHKFQSCALLGNYVCFHLFLFLCRVHQDRLVNQGCQVQLDKRCVTVVFQFLIHSWVSAHAFGSLWRVFKITWFGKKKHNFSHSVFGSDLSEALVLLSGRTYIFMDNYLSLFYRFPVKKGGQFG